MDFDLMNLFEDDDYISPGSIGGKIKRLRELRGLTQKQLGLLCGFSSASADVRIAQYEKNKKIPREKALKDICAALQIDECALFDADLLPYNRMYHALFDIEDFHGLHPVKKDDSYYLEFSGTTLFEQEIHRHDFDDFLAAWYEKLQKCQPLSSDSKEIKAKKATEYALWRAEYPENVERETIKRVHDQMKMKHLQAQMDALNAEMQSKSELARLDESVSKSLQDVKKKYKDITHESEFILLIKKMIYNDVPLERYSPEKNTVPNYDYFHVVSFKTGDIINNPVYQPYFAEFLCQIESMQKAGINIDRKITSKNKELYVTYELAASQFEYLNNLYKVWDDIVYIKERIGTWSDKEIKDLEKQLLDKITGKNDVTF